MTACEAENRSCDMRKSCRSSCCLHAEQPAFFVKSENNHTRRGGPAWPPMGPWHFVQKRDAIVYRSGIDADQASCRLLAGPTRRSALTERLRVFKNGRRGGPVWPPMALWHFVKTLIVHRLGADADQASCRSRLGRHIGRPLRKNISKAR